MTPTEYEIFIQNAGTPAQYADWITSVKEAEGIAEWYKYTDGSLGFLTKTGVERNVAQSYGEWLETRTVTNQLITKAEADAVTGSIEVYSGDVIDTATSTVLKHGSSASAVSLGTFASAGCAALGGVALGVNMYESNPDFWTALSQTLLPFCYEEPTQGGWDNVWDALFPVTVDSAGNTMVPYNAMQALNNFLASQNALAVASQTMTVDNVSLLPYDIETPLYICPLSDFFLEDATYIFRPQSFVTTSPAYVILVKNDQYYAANSTYYMHPICFSKESFSITWERVTKSNGAINTYGTYNSVALSTPYGYIHYYNGFYIGTIKATTLVNANPFVLTSSRALDMRSNADRNKYLESVAYVLYNGYVQTNGGIEGLTPQSGATLPVENQDISTTYPNWTPYTTYNVEGDDEGGQTIIPVLWLPLSLPKNNPVPEDFSTDQNQDEAQTGDASDSEQQDKVQPFIPTGTPTTPDDPTGNTGETPPFVPPFNGALAGIFHVYHPTLSELQALNAYMWTENIAKLIAEIFNNNPVDAIIGLQSIYITPHDGGRANIKLGYMDSGVESAYIDQQFITFRCGGPVVVPVYFQTAYDYDPYTKVYIYLPFIGIQPLSSYDIIGSSVEVEYTVDVLTGVCVAKIYVTKGTEQNSVILYTFEGSCACELPVTAGSRANQIKSTVGGVIGGAVAGAVAGPVGAVVGGVVGGIGGAARGADISMSGHLGGIAGACAPRKPYIIVKRTRPYNADRYNEFYGSPANATIRLGDVSGFTRVKKVHVDTLPNATNEEKIMIRDMLMGGVII